MSTKAKLIVDSSENNSDLYYISNFFVPDPVVFIEHDLEKILVLNDLELDRGKKESVVDTIFSLKDYINKLPKRKLKKANLIDIVELIFKERKIKSVIVQKTFPIAYADQLRKIGIKVIVSKDSFLYESRLVKRDYEIVNIKRALRKTAEAMNKAISLVASSTVKGKYLYYENKILTSEHIKQTINSYLAFHGYLASHTIAAGGVQGSMPHHTGEGPILAGWPIVIDIFPRSQDSGYYGDMTRTIVKGEPSKELIKMYNTVLKGQILGISLIKDGVRSKEVHEAILNLFEENGFKTGLIDGKPQGFIHSTGHGLGLDIHEPPRIGNSDEVLKEGNVVTVEPGLYYDNLGGIRIEDVVVVTKSGNVNLTKCRKRFKV